MVANAWNANPSAVWGKRISGLVINESIVAEGVCVTRLPLVSGFKYAVQIGGVQRVYKCTRRNVGEVVNDIANAIVESEKHEHV